MTDTIEHRIGRSAERLTALIGPLRAPRSCVDREIRLLAQAMAGLVGPDRMRRWINELTDREIAGLHDPKIPCRYCKGIGFTFALKEEAQCVMCCGLGVV